MFERYSPLEKSLLDFYSQSLELKCFDPAGARKNAKEWLDEAIKDSKSQGMYRLPENLGDLVFRNEATDAKLAALVSPLRQRFLDLRQEAVREEDFRWWWNLNDIERRMMIKENGLSNMALYILLREKGESRVQAAATVKRAKPLFGATSASRAQGDDAPLPCELIDRVNQWVIKNVSDPEFMEAAAAATSFNAYVRERLRLGTLQ